IADGLAAADKAKLELASANQQVQQQLSQSRDEITKRLADAEKRGGSIVEDAKGRAATEAAKIIADAKAEADQLATQARETLREQVAGLAVKGAEQILRREVSAEVHADLLSRLKSELSSWPSLPPSPVLTPKPCSGPPTKLSNQLWSSKSVRWLRSLAILSCVLLPTTLVPPWNKSTKCSRGRSRWLWRQQWPIFCVPFWTTGVWRLCR